MKDIQITRKKKGTTPSFMCDVCEYPSIRFIIIYRFIYYALEISKLKKNIPYKKHPSDAFKMKLKV